MKTMKFFTLFAGMFLGVFLTGCAVVDHTDDAVETARKFALEKARDLTEYERNIIRYALPELEEEEIFAFAPIKLTEYDHVSRGDKVKMHKTKHLDQQAVSFVWNIPSMGGEVVVYGTGDRSMRFWEPIRVLYRKRAKGDRFYEEAIKKVQSFTLDNMLYLTENERNFIRFSPGKVYCTSFDLSYLQEKKPSAANDVWSEYLKEKKEGKKIRFQISLVWQADDPAKVIVFTGPGAAIPTAKELENAAKEQFSLLSSWEILCVHVMKKDEFIKYTTTLEEAMRFSKDQGEK